MDAQPASVVVERRIEWIDTDAAGHYHWSTAFRLAEAAESVLHERLGFRDETFGRTPRVNVRAEFRRILRFGELVEVEFGVAAVGRTSVTYAFRVSAAGELAASGEIVSVLLDRAAGRPQPWPAEWRAALTLGGPQAAERLTRT